MDDPLDDEISPRLTLEMAAMICVCVAVMALDNFLPIELAREIALRMQAAVREKHVRG